MEQEKGAGLHLILDMAHFGHIPGGQLSSYTPYSLNIYAGLYNPSHVQSKVGTASSAIVLVFLMAQILFSETSLWLIQRLISLGKRTMVSICKLYATEKVGLYITMF